MVAIAAGAEHSLALRADGTVVAWGGNTYGQTKVPTGLSNVVAIAAWYLQILALEAGGPPFLPGALTDRTAPATATVYFRAPAAGDWPLAYQWRLNGTPIPGATNMMLTLTNVQPQQAGLYSVQVTNGLGTATSLDARLTVAPLLIRTQPVSQQGLLGATLPSHSASKAAGLWNINGDSTRRNCQELPTKRWFCPMRKSSRAASTPSQSATPLGA